jgi:hypothetical protein
MKRQPLILAVLAFLIVPTVAGGGSAGYGVAIRGAIVNRDRSVTIEWLLENANVFNSWIAVDGSIVRSGSDRATRFTTRPISGGSHTITIEVHAMFETYAPPGGGSCQVSGGHWLCVQRWRSATSVSVPHEVRTYCIVPRVVGLKLRVARARIDDARCSLGAVKRVRSERSAGTVLGQSPKSRRLIDGKAIRLVVSRGPRST